MKFTRTRSAPRVVKITERITSWLIKTFIFADFINILGVTAPPIIGPILVDFYFTRKQNYEFIKIEKLSSFNVAGTISFLAGAIFGLVLFFNNVDVAVPIAILSLLVSMIVYFVWTLLIPKSE